MKRVLKIVTLCLLYLKMRWELMILELGIEHIYKVTEIEKSKIIKGRLELLPGSK